MSNLIGITDEQLSLLIEEATKRGYEAARRDLEQSEWLTSRRAIIAFLSPEKPMSEATFNRNRAKGLYGTAIMGNGHSCMARKSDLLDAMRRYHLADC